MIDKCAESYTESRENVFSGPTAAGVTAPVKRQADCVYCGHLGVPTPAPLQRAGRVEGAAGAFKAKSYEGRHCTRVMAVVMVVLEAVKEMEKEQEEEED